MPRNKPNMALLRAMQKYSARAWVYREGQGWLFAEMTPEERAEFRSYEYGITIPRMRVRVPYGPAYTITAGGTPERYAAWFCECTIRIKHAKALRPFGLRNEDESVVYPTTAGTSCVWLWDFQYKSAIAAGLDVTVGFGYGWREWGIPTEWKEPLTRPPRVQCKEHTFIYALVDEIVQEVRYIGKSDDPEHRLADHLRDTKNHAKWEWIQSLRAQGRTPKLLILEEVAVAAEFERERYWISFY